MSDKSYFSVSYDLIQKNKKLPYDLYVNSSSVEDKQKFVKIFPAGGILDVPDLESFKKKYFQLYLDENQRHIYMRSLVDSDERDDVQTTNFIKDSAVQYLHKIFDAGKEFNTELLSETIGECRGAVESMIDVFDKKNIDSITNLIGSLSSHDFYTFDHSINVSMYCISILRALKPNATREELIHVGLGGLLHDLGKIKISTNILNSPGGLSEAEYGEIKKHPQFGIDLLTSGEVVVDDDLDLNIIGRVVHEHHENWDGKGYPNGLNENDIHVYARICTIADFFDALTTKRSYSDVLSVSKAIDVMSKFSATKLDPKLFKAFIGHVDHQKLKNKTPLKLSDKFDPTIPYEKFPLEEVKAIFDEENFGKIRVAKN